MRRKWWFFRRKGRKAASVFGYLLARLFSWSEWEVLREVKRGGRCEGETGKRALRSFMAIPLFGNAP